MDASSELDQLTFQRAQRGDHGAFRQLVERYHRPVFGLLFRMLEQGRSRQDVEDLTQETFLRVFRALGRFDYEGRAKLSSWILTIASRLALNELRRARVYRLPLNEESHPAEERADAALNRRRVGDAMRRAIHQLKPEFRIVVLLREYHGQTYEEIAETTGAEINTVKSRLSRGRALLREALGAALEEVRG